MDEVKPNVENATEFEIFMSALTHCDTVKVILTGCGETVFSTKDIYNGIMEYGMRRG